jgi:hypothetical protein
MAITLAPVNAGDVDETTVADPAAKQPTSPSDVFSNLGGAGCARASTSSRPASR